jgi:hypothetical protein
MTSEKIRSKFDFLRPAMDERMCRLWAANEARALGVGGEETVSAATELSCAQIRAGVEELERLAAVPVPPVVQKPKRWPRAVWQPQVS